MLLPGLLETARRNASVREERVHIFEVGKVFLPSGALLPDEPTRVGILVAGRWDEDSWLRSGAAVDYFLVKGLVERLSAGLHSPLVFSPVSRPVRATSSPSCIRARARRIATAGGQLRGLARGGASPGCSGLRPRRARRWPRSSTWRRWWRPPARCSCSATCWPIPSWSRTSPWSSTPAVPAAAVVESLRAAGGDAARGRQGVRPVRRRPGRGRQEEPGPSPELPRARPHAERGRGQRAAPARCWRRSAAIWGRNSGASSAPGTVAGVWPPAACGAACGVMHLACIDLHVIAHACIFTHSWATCERHERDHCEHRRGDRIYREQC